MLDGHTWPDGHTWRLSQREIREGKAPRRLAERCDFDPPPHGRCWSGAADLARRVALAVSVVFLVIASTVVHSDDYSPASRPYVGTGWRQFDLHLHKLNAAGTAVTDITRSNDDAWKAFVGFRSHPYINLEAAYVDFGHADDTFQTSGSSGLYHERIDLTNASGADAFWLSPWWRC
jgi:hypothetical protein